MISQMNIHGLIRLALNLPEDYDVLEHLLLSDVPGWDSLGWMSIVVQVEDELKREIPLNLFDDTETVQDFCDVIIEFERTKGL